MKTPSSQAPEHVPSGGGEHRLKPLLAPRSIALVGGSPREGSVGNRMIRSLIKGGFPGELSVVNPRYDSVEGLEAFPSLRDLPQPLDLAVISVSSRRMEALMREAIEAGARSAAVLAEMDVNTDRRERVRSAGSGRGAGAGVPLRGADRARRRHCANPSGRLSAPAVERAASALWCRAARRHYAAAFSARFALASALAM